MSYQLIAPLYVQTTVHKLRGEDLLIFFCLWSLMRTNKLKL